MAEDLAAALRWMSELLEELQLQYQVVGGLAARCHGAARRLVDIDLYVPDGASLARVASAAPDSLIRPPTAHRDEHWDLTYLALIRNGWTIEMAAASTAKVWDGRRAVWVPAGIRFEEGEVHEHLGVSLRVMPKAQLVDYKQGLGREVDRLDLAELEG